MAAVNKTKHLTIYFFYIFTIIMNMTVNSDNDIPTTTTLDFCLTVQILCDQCFRLIPQMELSKESTRD